MNEDFPFLKEMKLDPSTPAKDMLAKGISISYGDDRFPDQDLIVEEAPDGTKTLLRFNGLDFDKVKTL